MENDPECGAFTACHGRNAMAHADAVISGPAAVRTLGGGKDHERALGGVEDVRAALCARALLQQDELAAIEVMPPDREHGENLKREKDVAVEILMQRIPVSLTVTEDQRRRSMLTSLLA